MTDKHTIVLREMDQSRFNSILANFAKTQQNVLKFSEVVMLLLDRCIFCNKFTLGDFYKLFGLTQGVTNSKPLDKDELQGERILGRQQLIFLFHEIAKKLFKPDPNYHQKFYNCFLGEMISTEKDEINRSRVMVFDDTNKKLLVEDSIRVISSYEEELKNIFVAYTIQNYWTQKRAKRLLLSMREIILQNKKWSFTSLIFYLKESQTCPVLVTIEPVEEMMRLIIPNTNGKQQEFYSRKVLSDCYHKENENHEETSHPGDPGIVFFEYEFLMARIAWESFPRQLQKKSIADVIQRYFKYHLQLRTNQNLDNPLPSFNRKLVVKMKEYYNLLKLSNDKNSQQKPKQIQKLTPVQILAQKMESEITNAQELGFDFRDSFRTLDKELPKMPPLPQIVKQDPHDYITLGRQPPPEPVDKNEKPKADKKQVKKDEIPARQFKWADVPQTKYAAEDFLKQVVENKLSFEIKPLTDIQRGVIKREGYPTLITELLFPPQLPKSVVPFIQSASNALNNRNFILALQNYAKASAEWKNTAIQFDAAAQLFFQYSKGNVYLSAGKLQYAISSFYLCRKFSDTSKLPFSNPDRSLPYYGLGQVFYEMQEYELAARSFLKARQIRQNVLGLEHVQTASVFNNLACCFYMLGRSHQSLGYIQIAEVVIDTQLGPHHERTMVCRNNLKKIHRGTFDNKPQFRKLWQVFEEDVFEKKKAKKGAAEKKKK